MSTIASAHAAIDVGTNSVHLLVARPTDSNGWEILAQEKEVVRLGAGGGDMRHLGEDAIQRGIAALTRFRRIAEIWGADVTAVATSAVREAENHAAFLERARREAGVEVEIISGAEEARLIHVGVLHALPVYGRRLLVIDIGGGSTELLVGEAERVIDARSLKLGAIRLTDRFLNRDPLDPEAVAECRRYTRAFIEPTARELRADGFEVAAGSSGTIQTIASMVLARRGDDLDRSLNNLELERGEILDVVAEIVAASTARERARLAGMDPRRADIVVAGALILEQAVLALGIEDLRISTFALREGVLFDRIRLARAAPLHQLSDLRRASVLSLAARLDPDREHSEHLTGLALRLFDDTRELHQLHESHRELLEAAGLLHNVGLFISHSAHHKHSYYVIRNSDQLLGFTDHEVELIALIARYHRKSFPRHGHPELAGISPEDRRRVALLAGLLRVAIGLDRAHTPTITDVRARPDGDHSLLVIEALPAPGADPSLELYSARQRRGLLADALGREVEIVAGTPRSAP